MVSILRGNMFGELFISDFTLTSLVIFFRIFHNLGLLNIFYRHSFLTLTLLNSLFKDLELQSKKGYYSKVRVNIKDSRRRVYGVKMRHILPRFQRYRVFQRLRRIPYNSKDVYRGLKAINK